MKSIYKNKGGLLMVALLAIFTCMFSSCSEKEDGMGEPIITGVRSCDPAKADSLFSKSSQGQVVAVVGQNLADVRSVTINGQSVSFNPTMNTDHSVIITIPTEEKGFKLTAFNSDLKDEIVVVTSHGTATFQFKVLAPYPQLQRISALYPRNVGDKLEIYGKNLVDIEKVYITDVTGEALDTTVWKEVPGNHVEAEWTNVAQNHRLNSSTLSYETISQVEVTVPEGAPDKGALVFECAAGTVYLSYYRVPGQPVVLSCSNDMPQIGETLVLTGREFVQLDKITYGDVTLKAADGDFTVSASEDSIFIPFTKKPSPENYDMKLKVETPGGVATVDRFYDYSTILTTFDGDAIDNAWDPKAKYKNSKTEDGKYAFIKVTEGQQWWGSMIFYRKDWDGNKFVFSSNIPASATADELYFTMNVYDEGDFNNGLYWGYLRYAILDVDKDAKGDWANTILSQYDNFGWAEGGYDAIPQVGAYPDGPVLQDINGEAHKNQWYRAVVPLSKFSYYEGKSFSEIAQLGLPQFRIQLINQSTTTGTVNVRFDNIRVIYIPKK